MKRYILFSVLWSSSALAATPTPVLTNNGFVVTLFGGVYNSSPPTLTATQASPLQLDANGNLKVNVVTGGGGSGGSGSGSTFNTTFPTTGTAIGGQYAGLLQAIGTDGASDMLVNLRTSLPAGNNTIGFVGQSGTWTVSLTGTVPLPTGAATSVLEGGVYNANAVTLTNLQQVPLQLDSAGNLKVNIVTGGGSGAAGGTSSTFTSNFPVTGTAIGAYNGGNMVRVAADTANNLNVDLQTSLPSGSNTIGAVNQAGTWSATINTALPAGTNVIGAVTQSGTWSVAVSTAALPTGAATSANQASVTGAASPGAAATNALLTGGIYNSTAPTLTNGQQAAAQFDANGNLKVNVVAGGGGGSGGGTSSTFGLAFPSAGTAIGAKNGGNMVGLAADASGNLQVNVVASSVVATAANQTAVIGAATPGTAAASSTLMGAVYNAIQPAPTTGQQVATQADIHGNLRIANGSITKVPLDIATVTTGGTAVVALAAGHATEGGWIYNPDSATIDLCINEVATASGTTSSGSTTCVPPGTAYRIAPGTGAVSVISSDSAHAFSGYGYQ